MQNDFIYDDGGRAEAGYRAKGVGDCVPRAIAIATGTPYKKVLGDLYLQQKILYWNAYSRSNPHPTQGTHPAVYGKYLEGLGWKRVYPKGKLRFRKDNLPKRKKVIVQLDSHLAAVIDGKLRDTYESSKQGEKFIRGYWIKPSRKKLDR